MFNFNFFSYTKEFVVQSRDAKLIMSSTYEYQKSANFFVLDFRTNKINLRHSHTCWGTKGFSDLHDALNELKEIVLFATLKKKNFSNKNTSLHEKK